MLLIEDGSDDALLFALALEASHLSVSLQVLSDGQLGIDYLLGRGIYSVRSTYPIPDVVVVDARMPRVTGTEFLKWCRGSDLFANLPVVLLTGGPVGDAELEEIAGLGPSRVFIKPLEHQDLRSLIREIYDFGARSLPEAANFPATIEPSRQIFRRQANAIRLPTQRVPQASS